VNKPFLIDIMDAWLGSFIYGFLGLPGDPRPEVEDPDPWPLWKHAVPPALLFIFILVIIFLKAGKIGG